MNQKEFYITYTGIDNKEITTKVFAREDILNAINNALYIENDLTAKQLMNNVKAIHVLLLGIHGYKNGEFFISIENKIN